MPEVSPSINTRLTVAEALDVLRKSSGGVDASPTFRDPFLLDLRRAWMIVSDRFHEVESFLMPGVDGDRMTMDQALDCLAFSMSGSRVVCDDLQKLEVEARVGFPGWEVDLRNPNKCGA